MPADDGRRPPWGTGGWRRAGSEPAGGTPGRQVLGWLAASFVVVLVVVVAGVWWVLRPAAADRDLHHIVDQAARDWSARTLAGRPVFEVAVHGAWESCATASVIYGDGDSRDLVVTPEGDAWSAREPDGMPGLGDDEIATEPACLAASARR